MAAHSERYWSQYSTNILTARSRTSAEYVYFYALLHPLKGKEPPGFPGRLIVMPVANGRVRRYPAARQDVREPGKCDLFRGVI